MNKRTAFLFISVLVIIALYFGSKAFEKVFFNENYGIVPDLVGKNFEDASKLSNSKGFNLRKTGEGFSNQEVGYVYTQNPLPNTKRKKGRVIKVFVSKGKSQIVIPDFHNEDIMLAKSEAQNKKIVVKNVIFIHDSLGSNKVIATEPAAGEYVGKNAELTILVSQGNESSTIFMPDIVGIDLPKAKEILKKSNLIPGNIDYISDESIENDIVLDTNPKSGEQLSAGTVITITVNKK